jgi:hypothetical protein
LREFGAIINRTARRSRIRARPQLFSASIHKIRRTG